MPVDQHSLHLPNEAGVYLFKRDDGRVLYVGKATVLRERVRSYFASNPDREMIPTLVAEADHVDCIVTPNPREALMLERELIRRHKPRWNSLLKDDKSYPFIAFTDEEAPRILYTRDPPSGATCWGPFPDAGAAKRVVQLLRRQFGIRDCPQLLPQGCLAMHIGLCSAPCIDDEGYAERVDAAARVLDGDANILLKSLQDEMDAASGELAYERAGKHMDTPVSQSIELMQCVPVYERVPGWGTRTAGLRSWRDLPGEARRYLDRLSELTEVSVDIVSTGADRDDTLVIRHPFY